MSLPTSRLSYKDCFDLYDKALESERGVRVRMPDPNYANFFRMRMHKARSIVRDENRLIYELGQPLHGCSEYDPLVLKIRIEEGGDCWLYLEKVDAIVMEVEPIEDVPALPPPEEPLQIEHKQEVLPPIRRRL